MLERCDRLELLRFASAFLWADLAIDPREEVFLFTLARELGVEGDELSDVAALLERPPLPEEVDPTTLCPRMARVVRDVALRAIAADGHVAGTELELFDLLDELLPS